MRVKGRKEVRTVKRKGKGFSALTVVKTRLKAKGVAKICVSHLKESNLSSLYMVNTRFYIVSSLFTESLLLLLLYPYFIYMLSWLFTYFPVLLNTGRVCSRTVGGIPCAKRSAPPILRDSGEGCQKKLCAS
ncbi:hypothetical protein, unlikely [Trypanosoma brucei gambiense DAL972]|uniref:Uncharacterized protein n=1 Tax=Trypanosoma brucei gambiense (strain MHOM/CI/86/DAL972) TaxID=679716 RepID=D0AAF1_TRYB9|nr:hypothetical protein, unlikely [Trypanosoma brucei gambiense DAL972]CBH18652.1 hypothetical protein, unlikely [Trypanosoma brucei gambiense DAL972]|eukprot:XP_011780916.1 hypothetical protein, unlikely [Trypanosoma brucei gambiense DAL972]